MAMKLNPAGVAHALHLVETGRYAINTVWERNCPSAAQQASFREAYGERELAKWFLTFDDDGYALPHGDFNRVHRSGVVEAKRIAMASGQHDVVAAADEILDLFDRLNAC